MTTAERFAIRRNWWLQPLLWSFGGTASSSFVEIEAESLHVRFGWLFDKRIAFGEIEVVRPTRWPWILGLGWRSNLMGRIGLVGSCDGTVDIVLKRRRLVWLLFLPLPCNRLTVSLEEPEGFVTALRRRLNQ